MDGAGTIIGVVFVALILVGTVIGTQYAMSSAVDQTNANETFDAPALDERITFNASNIDGATYDNSPDMVDENETEYAPDSYRWNSENGTLVVESQTLANTTNNTIYYHYGIPNQQQDQARDFVSILVETGWIIPFVLILGLVFLALGIMGGLS